MSAVLGILAFAAAVGVPVAIAYLLSRVFYIAFQDWPRQ